MLDLIRDPYVWLGGGAVVFAMTGGLVTHLFATYVFSRYPIVEDEPQIDFDLLEAELSMDAAILNGRMASDRRAEMVARAS